MQGLHGTINVGNLLGFTALTLQDVQDLTGQNATLTDNGTNGSVTGLSPATINYTDNDISSLVVNGGFGGNTFNVNGTLANGFLGSTPTTLNTGTGSDTTNVLATNAGGTLTIHGMSGLDAVNIGNAGVVSGILGSITVDNQLLSTALTVDASNDPASHHFTLTGGATQSTLTNLSPAPITYTTGEISALTIDTGSAGNQVMNIDFGSGNPIPTAVVLPGVVFNAKGPSKNSFQLCPWPGCVVWARFRLQLDVVFGWPLTPTQASTRRGCSSTPVPTPAVLPIVMH